jgi:hypothetical protein
MLTILFPISANENTVAAGKKTILPADVFKALDDTEFSFLKGPLEAEFASMSHQSSTTTTHILSSFHPQHQTNVFTLTHHCHLLFIFHSTICRYVFLVFDLTYLSPLSFRIQRHPNGKTNLIPPKSPRLQARPRRRRHRHGRHDHGL